jgi:hypothetical protein
MNERPERELEDMPQQSNRLENEIDDARENWEHKKADSSVPGAVGDPEPADEGPDLDPRDPENEDL